LPPPQVRRVAHHTRVGCEVQAVSATVLRADARCLPLADASVDLIVTSPPYWALRSYTDGGEHYDGQIGAEPTPAAFIDNLIACTREWMRVLKPSGSLWVNLGDKYSTYESPNRTRFGGEIGERQDAASQRGTRYTRSAPAAYGVPCKSLFGLPWRYAIRCIDDLGLILRAEVIWSKPNGLPESVTDRVRRSHETWFHLTKEPRYFAAVDTIREPTSAIDRWPTRVSGGESARRVSDENYRHGAPRVPALQNHALGKLPGSVWTVATQPLTVPAELGVDHFAAFPMEWPRRIIQGWSPAGICTACGEGRRPDLDVSRPRGQTPRQAQLAAAQSTRASRTDISGGTASTTLGLASAHVERRIVGEACACPEPTAPTRPAVVLDPFGGTGTTALVAHALGRHGVSVDMSADYCRLARWRNTDPGQLAAALEVPKPPAERDGQLDLFGAAS
jgi:DNA modification methylase